MTIIDPVTNLVEIARVTSTKSAENARTFKNAWLSQHSKPDKVVADNGPEFNGIKWEFMLMDWGFCKGRISSHTPTANAIIESSHRVIGQILRTMLHGTAVRTKAKLETAFDDACAVATCVMQCVSNIALQGMAPGMLVFRRDMIVNIPVLTNIAAVSPNRQSQTDACLLHKNQQCTHYECKVEQQVHVNNHFSSVDKMKQAWVGPFSILCVHTNDTVTIQRRQTHKQISVCHIKQVLA